MSQIELAQIQNFEGKYPKQIWSLFFSEMWERFCFYGMRGMLTYFMVDQLLMNDKVANLQYGATQAFVYAFTFIGGLFADKILGFRKSLFWGALLMITGSILLAINPKEWFFLGITFNIIGTGFFKPNISSMVGQLYKENDTRRDAGFLLFYSGINIGAFIGGYIIAIGKGTMFASFIPEALRWNFAFGASAVAMFISLLTFMLTKKSLGTIGLSPLLNLSQTKQKTYEYSVYIGALLVVPLVMLMVSNATYTDYFMYIIGPFSLLYFVFEMTKNNLEENKKLIAAFLFIIFSVIFWAIFEQAGGSLSLFAKDYVGDKLMGLTTDPNAVNNSFNALFVILFAPLIGIVFIALSKKKAEPNSIIKFGLAFLLLGLAFYTFYLLRFTAGEDGKSSLNIFALAYLVVTFGELFLSPIGLSLMTKLSPMRMQGFMMGMWFLASAYGQYVAGLFGASISPNENSSPTEKLTIYTTGYKDFALYAVIAGVLLIAISPFFKKLMGGVK
ncbi:MAG: peptide MFS transporter [Flavobacteriia bacterium]|nr:peptide MFS transporter [Flavobacteriia bacterium]